MQKQHACIALILFNVPKGDTQLTYFWWAKFFTCRVAWALFGQEEKDYKEIKEDQTTQAPLKWARTSEVGQQHQCTISHLQTVNIYSAFPELRSHWMTDKCCENTFTTHNRWLTVYAAAWGKKGLQKHSPDLLNQLQTSCLLGCTGKKIRYTVKHNFCYIHRSGNPSPCNRESAYFPDCAE